MVLDHTFSVHCIDASIPQRQWYLPETRCGAVRFSVCHAGTPMVDICGRLFLDERSPASARALRFSASETEFQHVGRAKYAALVAAAVDSIDVDGACTADFGCG